MSDDERRARLAVRHALAPGHRAASVRDAADTVVCFHATEPANVYLSAFARSGALRADVYRALYEERSVVLQLAMRRTVFAFAHDLRPAVLGSASARVAAQLTRRLAKDVQAAGWAEDGAGWVARTGAAVCALLREQPMTTAQLRGALPELQQRIGIPPGSGLGSADAGSIPVAPRLLSVLAADGSVVRGTPAAGWKVSRPHWTLASQWLDEDSAPLDPRAGYAELVGRWLKRFGPGTEDDLAWWLGATKGAVRAALHDVGAVGVALEQGESAWVHPGDTDVAAPEPWAALLPALDPTTMGWKGRGFYLGEHAAAIFDRNGNGGPTAWWDGRIVGGWTQADDGTVLVVPATPLASAARDALDAEAQRLTAWLDGDIVRSLYQSPLARAHHAART